MVPQKTPNARGPRKDAWSQKEMPNSCPPGFKSQRQSSSADPFLAPPTFGHSCQHSRQVWPCGVEPIISKLFWTPLQIPTWGPSLGCTLLQICCGFSDLKGNESTSSVFEIPAFLLLPGHTFLSWVSQQEGSRFLFKGESCKWDFEDQCWAAKTFHQTLSGRVSSQSKQTPFPTKENTNSGPKINTYNDFFQEKKHHCLIQSKHSWELERCLSNLRMSHGDLFVLKVFYYTYRGDTG